MSAASIHHVRSPILTATDGGRRGSSLPSSRAASLKVHRQSWRRPIPTVNETSRGMSELTTRTNVWPARWWRTAPAPSCAFFSQHSIRSATKASANLLRLPRGLPAGFRTAWQAENALVFGLQAVTSSHAFDHSRWCRHCVREDRLDDHRHHQGFWFLLFLETGTNCYRVRAWEQQTQVSLKQRKLETSSVSCFGLQQ